jgi:putative phosphoribosyl transferase
MPFHSAAFADRTAAGVELAERVAERLSADGANVVVCALPRGGVPVAVPVAERLHATLDAIIVRKLRAPGQPELAMGALAWLSGTLAEVRSSWVRVPTTVYDAAVAHERAVLADLDLRYRGGRPAPDLTERVVIVVDDGLATGATTAAAVQLARTLGAARVMVAAPVGSTSACELLEGEADEVVCLSAPEDFRAVSLYYRDFSPPSDESVRRALSGTS